MSNDLEIRMICNKCGQDKPETEFYIRPSGRPRLDCKICVCRRSSRELSLREYGITEIERVEMIKAQDAKCKICNLKKRLHVDHDHKTGIIRGLLCFTCNIGISKFKDNLELLKKAAAYLNKKNKKDLLSLVSRGLPAYSNDRNCTLLSKYGISLLEYEELAKQQFYSCAICKIKIKLHVDHCHQKQEIRGLLCFACNSGLGSFQDSMEVIRQAIEYLEKPREVDLYQLLIRDIRGVR